MTDDATLTDFFESEGAEDDAREGDADTNADAAADPDPSDADESQSELEDGGPEQRRPAGGDREERAADSDREQRERTESTDGVVDVETAVTDDKAIGDDSIDEEPIGDTGRSTYGWGEYTCRRCGSDTDRVWREDGDLVCPDCKNW
ncbi:hypothetical protein C477_05997 [Haloterrigena salina JCM 13891]|uniref:DUF7573 domain-containing protein n=1 Tax=Haloterrigena salina JCM 13891 TaxID=1227488 RepID=M0CFA8_9EURY|nr:hypothetical protein [Haloterrigena salina]ELZ21027.1 hypothetical protein C477_05997 [Haloterrigena salina JCM 13891]